ncbi:MAG TPA: FAD-dependent oxidoreductase [Aliidongia sp.]|nr:FAD-dependent oxidoreductase [Aliidongia sp.]
MKIAIIGGGVAGLGCAWLLGQRHEVTLYEAADRLGGHANTIDVPTEAGALPVDTGFIVYNEMNYPELTRLFAHLGVETTASGMSFSVSRDQGRLEYAGHLKGLFGQPRNLFSRSFHHMLGEVLRFYREAPLWLENAGGDGSTLGEYLARNRYSDLFIDSHILPMGAAIWSCPVERMMAFPAASFIRFCVNHGLLKLGGRPAWRTVTGGSRRYVEKLAAGLEGVVHLSTPIAAVRPDGAGVTIIDREGAASRHDQAVLACHADQALSLLTDDTPHAELLGHFHYQENRAVLHRDRRLMPRRRAVWSSWNYAADVGRDVGARTGAVAVTYWMNRLQALPRTAPSVFVSLNPLLEPDSTLIYRDMIYRHPLFDHAAIAAQRRLPDLQGIGGLWLCGSYCGWGFHEDALVSAMKVAAALDCAPPWAST